ncbi:MAG TPA: TonB-dependent receptor [Vicinamibacteria bacterium]
MKRTLLALAALLSLASAGLAQFAGGNIYGAATDESGAALPGATITLTSTATGTRSTTSGTQGDFRFLSVDPGRYQVVIALTGFATVKREVVVNTGVNVNLAMAMKVATVEETVTVTAETPIVDTKKGGTGMNVSREELSKIPNGRDPWVILQTIPGVVVDRVNIAGNESGQQSLFQGKGSERTDATWSLDGVTVTDTGALGSSPNYFDFNSFDEVNFSTGGTDLKQQTGGIGLSFVTRRGTNSFHGALNGVIANRDLESSNLPADLEGDARLRGNDKADHIDQVGEYGAELGGPILRDKLWFWVAYDKQDIRIERLNQTKDRTVLDNWSAKLNWQAGQKDQFSAFWYLGEKIKYGRAGAAAGLGFASVVDQQDALWGQGGVYQDGRPKGLLKLEWNRTFSPSFFTSVKAAYYNTGFSLNPNGGTEATGTVNLDTSRTAGSLNYYSASRPQYIANFDGNYFAAGWGGNHELKFGFGYRSTPVESITSFGGDRIMGIKDSRGGDRAWVIRDRVVSYGNDYLNAYLGDTFTKDRFTLNLGLRFDRQSGENSASTAVANPGFPELLPGLDFAGGGTGVTWTDVSPRVSFTYALNESRKTVVRASYARYASQLGTGPIDDDNPLSLSYLAYRWNDANADGFAQKAEILTDRLLYYYGVNPANPGNAASSPNVIDPDFKAKHDQEVIVGLDHELAPNFAVGVAYTWRQSRDVQWGGPQGGRPRVNVTTADYVPLAPITAGGFTAIGYDASAASIARSAGGLATRNRPDYGFDYSGFELSLNKRLSGKWMGRVSFSWMDWTEQLNGPAAIQDPSSRDVNALIDGGQWAPLGGGSGKGNIFFNTKWQVSANGLYQLPWGFEIAGSLFGRQGFPFIDVIRTQGSNEGFKNIVVQDEVDTNRYPDVWNVDFRLAKNIKIAGSMSLNVNLDLFNAFNGNVVLVRQRTLNTAVYNRIDEILSPRILRIGATLRF